MLHYIQQFAHDYIEYIVFPVFLHPKKQCSNSATHYTFSSLSFYFAVFATAEVKPKMEPWIYRQSTPPFFSQAERWAEQALHKAWLLPHYTPWVFAPPESPVRAFLLGGSPRYRWCMAVACSRRCRVLQWEEQGQKSCLPGACWEVH